METTTLAPTNENLFMFDLHSSFRKKLTAKCHNTIAVKKDYKTFAKKVEEIVEYVSGIEVMHSVPDHVAENIKLFLECTDAFVEIVSTSLDGLVNSEREDIEAILKAKTRTHFSSDKKRELMTAINKDEAVVNAICNSFNTVIESLNTSMDNIDELMDIDKITKPALNGIISEIKNIASLSLGYHCMLYNLVSAMSKYKMDYNEERLLLCFTGKKKDEIIIEKV